MVQSISREGQRNYQISVNTFFCVIHTHYSLPVCFPRLCKLLGKRKRVSLELLFGEVEWSNAGVLDGVGLAVSDST
jgi:hypothetical protein